MTEHPMLFSGTMIRALLDGTKTQTRRIIKPPLGSQAQFVKWEGESWLAQGLIGDIPIEWRSKILYCPHGVPGDRIWCKETFSPHPEFPSEIIYRADRGGDYQGQAQGHFKWKPSIFMPRSASRITLEIVSVGVERLNDITEADAKAEGAQERHNVFFHDFYQAQMDNTYRRNYAVLWETINGKRSWADNPFVWKITFRRIKPCADEMVKKGVA